MTQDVSSTATNPVLWNKSEYTEEKLSSTFLGTFPALTKESKTWPHEIPVLKKYFPSTHRRVIERSFVFQDVEIDTEEPDDITKLSKVVELIREKNKKRELKKRRKNQKRRANKKAGSANFWNFGTPGQESKDKFTKAIIKKKPKSNIGKERSLVNSKNSLDFAKVFQKIPRVDSPKAIIDRIVERARLLSFLENLYRQSFPEEVVRKILKKYAAEDLVERSADVSVGKINDKIDNPKKLENDKIINVMIINSKEPKNVEQQKPRTKRSAGNTPVNSKFHVKSKLILENLYRQSFPEEVVRQIIDKYSVKNLPNKAIDTKTEKETKDQVSNPEESGKNKTENVVVKDEDHESLELDSSKTRVKRSTTKTPVDPTTPEPKLKTSGESKNPKVARKGLYRHPRLTLEDQRDALPEILGTNPPPLARVQLQNTTPRSNFLYQRIWDIINDTRSGWPDKDSYKVNNTASTLKKVESQRLDKPYMPVLSDCKDAKAATASEVADLTTPIGKLQSGEPKKAGEDDKLPFGSVVSSNKVKESIPTARQTEALSWKPISVPDKKDIYANLQDHRGRDVPTYPPDIPPYNPDKIPYVDVPDYSDQREESLDKDEEPVRKLKEEPDVVDPTEDRSDDVKLAKASSEKVDDDEGDGKVLSLDKSSGPRADKPTKSSSDEKTPRRRSDEAEEDKKPEESGKVQKEESAEDFEVHFDINEYRKPFNFEEFLKNDPIFKELRTSQEDEEEDKEKEETKENRSAHKLRNKEIPVYEDERKEDYANPEEYRGSSESESDEERDYHRPSANENHSSVDQGNYTDDSKEDLEERVTEEEFKYGDRDFFKPFLNKPARSTDNLEDQGEDEFVSRYFSDDVRRKLKESLDEEARRKRAEQDEEEKPRKVYKTLTTIVDKRGEKEGAKDDEKKPRKYDKYWVLEYKFPRKDGDRSKQNRKH